MVLATQLAKNNYSEIWRECLQTAWNEVKGNPAKYIYIRFEKVNGDVVKRVILNERWSDRYATTGTGRKLKPGQRLYLDAAKDLCGFERLTGSYYEENMKERF